MRPLRDPENLRKKAYERLKIKQKKKRVHSELPWEHIQGTIKSEKSGLESQSYYVNYATSGKSFGLSVPSF